MYTKEWTPEALSLDSAAGLSSDSVLWDLGQVTQLFWASVPRFE